MNSQMQKGNKWHVILQEIIKIYIDICMFIAISFKYIYFIKEFWLLTIHFLLQNKAQLSDSFFDVLSAVFIMCNCVATVFRTLYKKCDVSRFTYKNTMCSVSCPFMIIICIKCNMSWHLLITADYLGMDTSTVNSMPSWSQTWLYQVQTTLKLA